MVDNRLGDPQGLVGLLVDATVSFVFCEMVDKLWHLKTSDLRHVIDLMYI